MDRRGFKMGLDHFNAGEFFEAHEVWEDVWRPIDSPEEKLFVQGLIQVAVAFHHHSTGNYVGAESLLRRATGNLAAYPSDFGGIDLAGLSLSLEGWLRALKDGATAPPKPRLELLPE